MHQPRPGPVASIVVPAHNEAAVIGRLLGSLERQETARQLEVVVVPNGCTDDTAQIASRHREGLPGLMVVEQKAASKRGALRRGDEIATTFPRIFVDADIEFTENAVDHLVKTLSCDQARIGAPAIHFDDTDASHAVKAFYRVFTRLPYATRGLVGLGVYGLSRSGRRRFGSFPDVTADDLFVQQLFSEPERVISTGRFIVRTPRDLRALIKVRTRVAAGNRELTRWSDNLTRPTEERTSRSTLLSLARLAAEDVRRLPDVVVYVLVTAASRLRARRFDAGVWHRDETSRQ